MVIRTFVSRHSEKEIYLYVSSESERRHGEKMFRGVRFAEKGPVFGKSESRTNSVARSLENFVLFHRPWRLRINRHENRARVFVNERQQPTRFAYEFKLKDIS